MTLWQIGGATIHSTHSFASSVHTSSGDAQLRDLILRAQGGDREAIGGLLERYRNYLRQIARRRMTSPLAGRLDASDLVQDALVEAHVGIDQLLADETPDLRACLRRILCCNIANAVRDHLRTAKRNADREQPMLSGCEPAADDTSPSMQVHRRDVADRFLRILEEIPEDEATAIQLRYFGNASVSEIAESLGRSRGAAASLLKRGLTRMRSVFQQQDESGWI